MSESEPQATSADPGDDALVLAMPRKELYRLSGFTSTIDMAIIEALNEDAWYALPSTLVGNLDAKEVRLGLVVTAGDRVLVDEGGNLLHTTPIGPEVARLGRGLKALRDLAALAGARFVGVERLRSELAGYLNDDSLGDHRHAFVMVYRCRVDEGVAAPAGLSWISQKSLSAIPLDPASILVAGGLFAPPHG